MVSMSAQITHFALNADDVDRSKSFYENVFGWTFTQWGPPGFFQITTGPDDTSGVQGALQQRRALIDGQKTIAPECTFSVDDVDATKQAVLASGGRILMDRSTIRGVGHLIFFEDPAGNAIGAMQFDPGAE